MQKCQISKFVFDPFSPAHFFVGKTEIKKIYQHKKFIDFNFMRVNLMSKIQNPKFSKTANFWGP